MRLTCYFTNKSRLICKDIRWLKILYLLLRFSFWEEDDLCYCYYICQSDFNKVLNSEHPCIWQRIKLNFRINFLHKITFVVHKRLLEQLFVNESIYFSPFLKSVTTTFHTTVSRRANVDHRWWVYIHILYIFKNIFSVQDS